MNILDISWFHLSLGTVFIIIALGVSLYESLKIESQILIGSLRATVQLIFVGYLIQIIFDLNEWYIVLIILVVMVLVASQTLIKRLKQPITGTYVYALIAVSIASVLSVILLTRVVIQIDPWYDPRYLIPLSGMIIANGMNGASLAGERFKSEMEHRLPEMEMLLSLGYDSRRASEKPRQQALIAGLIPSLNNLMVMGIVSLPGMMTGQIIAGSSPVTAVKYQIIIVISILATVSLTSWILITLLEKRLFTPHHQIRYDLIGSKKKGS